MRYQIRLLKKDTDWCCPARSPKHTNTKQCPAQTIMQLIPRDIHNATRHTGGSATIRNGGFD